MQLFDLHCDTLYECYAHRCDLFQNEQHIDFQRGRQYAPWIQVFAVWTPDTLRGEAAFDRCRDMLLYGRRQVQQHPEAAVLLGTDGEWETPQNRCGVLFAAESGAVLAGRLDTLPVLRDLGVRLITLTWNGDNELGHGALSACPDGLTDFGKAVVRDMERLGMWVDVSHLNEAGFWDVLRLTNRPVLATHSVSAAVHPHPRNLSDAQFDALRERGGLVGLNVCADQLGEQSFACMERHLRHFLERDGAHTVALGLDLDGTDVREDWHGVDTAGLFYDYLRENGYAEPLLSGIFFENAREFFKHS